MLVVETIARIRREHFIKGKTIKEIARDLKVSRNTVRKVLRSGETSFECERLVQPRPKQCDDVSFYRASRRRGEVCELKPYEGPPGIVQSDAKLSDISFGRLTAPGSRTSLEL